MSRIGFLADTQIGVGTVELADQRDVLDRIVQVMLEREVDVVVHGGDVFEGPVVTPEHLRLFLDATEPLLEAGIPMVVLRGNGRHDSAVRSVHALDVLRWIAGFHVADRPEVFTFKDFDICALPWVHPGGLIAKMNGSVDHALVNTAASELLVKIASELAETDHDGQKILVAHWAISSAKLPSGLPVTEMGEPVLPWAELDGLGYDLIVGAHIHEQQILSNPEIDNGPGFVIGSPQQLNFGESGEHGCWIADFPLNGDPEFVPIESREFVTLDFEHPEMVVWEFPPGAIVRVRVRATAEEAQKLDLPKLRRDLLDGGAHSVRIDLDIERAARRRAEIDEQFTPAEAMSLYCDATEIADPMRGRMVGTIKDWSEE